MLLRSKGAISSNSRKGTPYDNAPMETFYKTIKRELINDAKFESPNEAKGGDFKYIETYYNTRRMYSAIGFFIPIKYERKGVRTFI